MKTKMQYIHDDEEGSATRHVGVGVGVGAASTAGAAAAATATTLPLLVRSCEGK